MWRFEVFKDGDGWSWRLIQADAMIVAGSLESFEHLSDAKLAIENVREEIYTAPVEVR